MSQWQVKAAVELREALPPLQSCDAAKDLPPVPVLPNNLRDINAQALYTSIHEKARPPSIPNSRRAGLTSKILKDFIFWFQLHMWHKLPCHSGTGK